MSVLKFENGDPLPLIVNKIIAIAMNFTHAWKAKCAILTLKYDPKNKSFSLHSNLNCMKFTDRIKVHHFLVLVMSYM